MVVLQLCLNVPDFDQFFWHFLVQGRKITHECYARMLCINVQMNMGGGGLEKL